MIWAIFSAELAHSEQIAFILKEALLDWGVRACNNFLVALVVI